MFGNGFPSHPDEGRCRTVSFKTTVIAAGTGNTVQIKDHVPELSSDMMRAAPYPTVNNDPASDAGSDCDKDTGGSTGTDSGNAFRKRGNIGIIINM